MNATASALSSKIVTTPTQDCEHPVLRLLRERIAAGSAPGNRADGQRLVLSIEGGGNRGVIAGGMAQALAEGGFLDAVDAVYGSSSGALTAAWLLSGDVVVGVEAWTRPESFAEYSRPTHPLRRRPLIDLEWLIGEYYDRTLGLDAESVLANPVGIHPLATDAATGRATDLHPFIHDKASLHRAMRASCSLPIVAGRPVELAGGRYLDAGIAEAIPLETPLAAGATHVLVLSSRRDGELSHDSAWVRRVTSAWLRRHAPAARRSFLGRSGRSAAVAERLAQHNQDPGSMPSIMTVRPAEDAPDVGRTESDAGVMTAGCAAGHDAMRTLLEGTARTPRA